MAFNAARPSPSKQFSCHFTSSVPIEFLAKSYLVQIARCRRRTHSANYEPSTTIQSFPRMACLTMTMSNAPVAKSTVLSWKDGSLAAHVAGNNVCSPNATKDNSKKTIFTTDIAARTAELVAKINALKVSIPPPTTKIAESLLTAASIDGGVKLDDFYDGDEEDLGCMLKEMGEWCACCA